jgi:hypothetical protein
MKTTVLSIIIFIVISCCTEKNLYKTAIKTNTIDGYENYLANYKNGQYAHEVSQKIEEIKFDQTRDSVFSRFIKIKVDTSNFEDCIKIKPFNKVLMGTLFNIKLDNLPQNKNVTLHA